jgi:hypothetical protein
METPSSDAALSAPSYTSPSTPALRSDRISRETARFLREKVVPVLTRDRHRSLTKIVRRAVQDDDLRPLGELTERDRRILFATVEAALSARRSTVPPRAVVRLTSIVSGVAEPDLRFSRWRTTAPAR